MFPHSSSVFDRFLKLLGLNLFIKTNKRSCKFWKLQIQFNLQAKLSPSRGKVTGSDALIPSIMVYKFVPWVLSKCMAKSSKGISILSHLCCQVMSHITFLGKMYTLQWTCQSCAYIHETGVLNHLGFLWFWARLKKNSSHHNLNHWLNFQVQCYILRIFMFDLNFQVSLHGFMFPIWFTY